MKLDNYAQPIDVRGGAQYYSWKVFVAEPDEVLDRIESVTYELHPTFPDPKRTSSNRADRFGLESAGWGEFTIVANVRLKDGRTEVASHTLDLSKSWPQRETVEAY